MNPGGAGLFVLTGGPGSGKSTLIERLRWRGYSVSVEAGRSIIKDQVAIGGSALPWGNREAYAEMMLCWDMRSYRLAFHQARPTFFDRAIPDIIGYRRLIGLPVPIHMRKAATIFRYDQNVLIAPPWQEIYAEDTERKQDFTEALETHACMRRTYVELGYDLIELPRVSIEERLEFVIAALRLTNQDPSD